MAPFRWAGLLFTGAVAIQGTHMVEHVAQAVQRFGLGLREAHGVAGAAVDREVVHLAYNAALLAGIVALAVLLGLGASLRGRASWAAPFAAALAVQAYHFGEHVLKFQQFLAAGRNDTPGLLGLFVPGILLHFAINLVVLSLLTLAWVRWRDEQAWARAAARARLAGRAPAASPLGPHG